MANYTKYNVEGLGENLNKRQLVFTIVKDWVEKNKPNLEELQKAFPDEIQGSKGVVKKEVDIKDPKRYNMKEPIKIKNGAHVVVSNQWGDNIEGFIAASEKLGYVITSQANTTKEELEETGSNNGLSKEDVTALTETDSGYEFSQSLAKALGKEHVDALDYEPILIEMANENTICGHPIKLPVFKVAGDVNNIFGELCHRAHYNEEEKITKTSADYQRIWGELVTALAARAETATDYINLACCMQMQFAAFEDRDEGMQFANENYYKAIEMMDNVEELVNLVGGHLKEEYYENEELTEKAGEKALSLASTFQDYALICFDENERCLFEETDIYENAAAKAVELKDQADEDEIDGFKFMLEDVGDEENLKKF